MKKMTRRTALKSAIIGGIAAASKAIAGSPESKSPAHPTPPEIKGPFYPVVAQKDKDFDLTRIQGRDASAKGETIVLEGRVVNTAGAPISDATVDVWHACASGKYSHPNDPNPAPADPNFQGWAIVPSGAEGGFRFKTIMPGPYPVSKKWSRPPHIHFKVSKRGFVELVTQMYFPDHPLNEKDRLLQRKTEAEQPRMMATQTADAPRTFRYEIVLQEV